MSDDQTPDSQPTDVQPTEPWYKDGLNFTCSQCGNCCTGAPGLVWVDEEEIQEIADHLDKPVGEIRLFHTRLIRGRTSLVEHQNGDCTFFDAEKRHCKVYPVRPIQCRTWPFWNSNLDSEEAWKKTCDYCPGSGEGKFFSLEDIEEKAKQIDI